MGMWKVELSGKAKKAHKLLSKNAHTAFGQLLMDLEMDQKLKIGQTTEK